MAGYGEFESLKEKLQLVQQQISEGTAEAPTSVRIYGRNGMGKSTLIQNMLRLDEAPQVSH
jgi:ABC-type cobalamin/Fe3+-siderophores transport system ATPase subunit